MNILRDRRYFIVIIVLFCFLGCGNAQTPDTIYREAFSYKKQLDNFTNISSRGFSLVYNDLDTGAQQMRINMNIYCSRHFMKEMVRKFQADTISEPIEPDSIISVDNSTFSFGKMTLKWYVINKCFLSEGPLPLLAINGQPVNKHIEGVLMLERGKGGDRAYLFLVTGSRVWFTFTFLLGYMHVYSSDNEMNELTSKVSARKRNLNEKDGKSKYKFLIGSPADLNMILKKAKRCKDSIFAEH
ncbi:MAG TPA: hypothetical protein VI731_09755 [Bacteroidia bacterium]|nr:hypothetical protein [Bacteroidia bacterium]